MEEVSVADFKAKFSEMLAKVRQGESIAIRYGRKKERVAILVPPTQKQQRKKRTLGVLKGKATFKIRPGFKMTEEELLLG